MTPFHFGIYPGGEAGTDDGVASGPAGDAQRTLEAVRALQGDASPFVIRAYERFSDATAPSRYGPRTPENYEGLAGDGRLLDLVVMFQSASGDVDTYLDFLRSLIRRHASSLYSVQVTEEANFIHGPDAIDGPYPRVIDALVQGVCAARKELDALGLTGVPVGFSTTPTPATGPASEFWRKVRSAATPDFASSLGYVALDFFPDVFAPMPDVVPAADGVLQALRRQWMVEAGLGAEVPIHIGEHGWPTGPNRSYERQAEVLEAVIRTVHSLRESCHITRYTMFDLRDANSSYERDGFIFYQFGILRDDYTPKPAFERYRALIAELSSRISAGRVER